MPRSPVQKKRRADPRPKSFFAAVVLATLLGIGTFAVFSPALDNQFLVFDDDTYVTENPQVLSGLTRQSVAWAFTTGHDSNWFPLTWLSHMLDVELFGVDPRGHHATNLILHAASCALLFAFLVRTTGGLWWSALGAAVFALHPLRVESVAWVAERKDVLSVFLAMGVLWAYAGYAARPTPLRMAGVVALFALGLCAKSMLVTLPFALMLLDYWPLRRFSAGERSIGIARWIAEKIPLFVLAALSCVVTFRVQQAGGSVSSIEALPLWARLQNGLMAYVGYLENFFWPDGLAPYYPHAAAGLAAWKPALAALGLAALSAILWKARRSAPAAWVGWLWFLGTLVPVIGLVQVGGQAMADRYTYLPSVGLSIALAGGLPWLALRRYPLPVVALSIACLVALGTATRFQLRHWVDGRTLFTHTLNVTENNALAHKMLGTILARAGEHEAALDQYDRALQLDPVDGWLHNNLANSLLALGRSDRALVHYRKAVESDPRDARIRFNRARALFERADYEAAAAELERALELDPDLFEARYTLALSLHLAGHDAEARAQYDAVLRLRPDTVDAHLNLASLLAKHGEPRTAAHHLERALVLEPDNVDAKRRLAALRAQTPPVGAAPRNTP